MPGRVLYGECVRRAGGYKSKIKKNKTSYDTHSLALSIRQQLTGTSPVEHGSLRSAKGQGGRHMAAGLESREGRGVVVVVKMVVGLF